MKKTIYCTAFAALIFSAASLRAQVVVGPANGNVVAPVPATPQLPTPGAERRAVRREDRRIDRNDPTGTLAPTVNPNGTVTAAPAARAYSYPPAYNNGYYGNGYYGNGYYNNGYNNGYYRRGLFGRRVYY